MGIHFLCRRRNYEDNSAVSAFGKGYSIYRQFATTTPWAIAGGAGFLLDGAPHTHSVRVSYEKFHNRIRQRMVSSSSTYYGVPGIEFPLL